MNSWIVKYDPLCEITTYSKKVYYVKAKNREALEQMMEEKKFVKFWTATVNVSSIDTIDLAKPEDNFYQEEIKKYSYDEKNIINTQIKFWKDKTHNTKNLTPAVLKQIVDTYILKK